MEGNSSVHSVDGSQDEEVWSRRQLSSSGEEVPSGFAAVEEVDAAEEGPSSQAAFLPPLPRRSEPTLKERLVERERQARVETERARLKRQFALSSNGGDAGETESEDLHATREHGSVAGTVGEESSVAVQQADSHEESESRNGAEVANKEPLGYAMERFLADGTVDAEATATTDDATTETGVIMERFLSDPVVVDPTVHVHPTTNGDVGIATTDQVNGVHHQSCDEEIRSSSSSFTSDFIGRDEELGMAEVSERNRIEEQVIESALDGVDPVQNVAGRPAEDSDVAAGLGSIRSYSSASEGDLDGHITSTSLEITVGNDRGPSVQSIESQDGSHLEDNSDLLTGASHDHESPPRVFRLTEAEIQEMAAIEEASIGNAPPSERDGSFSESLVGDMVRDFGGSVDRHGTMSERTQTTVLESVSATEHQSSDNVPDSARSTEDSIGDVASVSSHLILSSGAGSDGSIASVTAMPPSVTDEPPHVAPHTLSNPDEIVTEESGFMQGLDSPAGVQNRVSDAVEEETLEDVAIAAQNAGVVNRTIRPGHIRTGSAGERTALSEAGSSTMKKSSSLPLIVDGFDFDKHDPMSPLPRGAEDSYGELPDDDLWSPAGKMAVSPHGKMTLSPFRLPLESNEEESFFDEDADQEPRTSDFVPQGDEENLLSEQNMRGRLKDYGTGQINAGQTALEQLRQPPLVHLSMGYDESGADNVESNERKPLMQLSNRMKLQSKGEPHGEHENFRTFDDMVGSVFSSVRSDSTATVKAEENESDLYLAHGILARAFPERYVALMVTLLVEIPTVVMISGGSDRLCMLIGRSRYQLMMAFLPLSSAISGNVGLQASTLTTRAISHRQVTKTDYRKWFSREVGAAAYLGFGMGVVIGTVAYIASGYDFGFGFTIFMAQQVSILTAGVTGTFAPLLFSFIFNRDSGKWGGPLETAVQDIVGSFAMVIMSYRILMLFPQDVDPNDTCGG